MVQMIAMDGQPELHILTIYEDLDGNATIFKGTIFDLSVAAGVSAAASIDPEAAVHMSPILNSLLKTFRKPYCLAHRPFPEPMMPCCA